MYKTLLFIFSAFFSVHVLANSAICNIQIQDVSTGTKYNVTHNVEYTVGAAGDRKVFKLPGSNYECYFTFFTLEVGTSLACKLDETGQNYVQSDRSVIEEENAKNNLVFRFGKSHYVIESWCKIIPNNLVP